MQVLRIVLAATTRPSPCARPLVFSRRACALDRTTSLPCRQRRLSVTAF